MLQEAPAAPAPAPAQPAAPAAPAAPAGKPAAPGEKLTPGAGDAGIQALGWTPQEIQTMTDEQKQGILQLKLMKPGTQLPQPPSGKPPGQPDGKSGVPPKAPAGPAGPAGPPGPGEPAPGAAPAPAPQEKVQPVVGAISRMLAQVDPMAAPPVDPTMAWAPAKAAPAPAPVEVPADPAALAPGGEAILSPEEQAFSVLREVQSENMSAIDPKQLVSAKSQELIRRLQTEIGMTVQEAEKLFGVSKSKGFSSLFS